MRVWKVLVPGKFDHADFESRVRFGFQGQEMAFRVIYRCHVSETFGDLTGLPDDQQENLPARTVDQACCAWPGRGSASATRMPVHLMESQLSLPHVTLTLLYWLRA